MLKGKWMKWISHLLTMIIIFLLVGLTYLVISVKTTGAEPELFGYQFKSVLSGSMEPDIPTGSLIQIKVDDDVDSFKENDVITFVEEGDILITHRITEVIDTESDLMYRTKGDNNNAEDSNPVLLENVVGQYTGVMIPYLGYLIHFAQSKNGAFLLLIPGFLLLCYSGYSFWKTIKEVEQLHKKEQQAANE